MDVNKKPSYKYNYHISKFNYMIDKLNGQISIMNCNYFSKRKELKEYLMFFEEFFERSFITLMKKMQFALIFN
jgi:hypothetical protein